MSRKLYTEVARLLREAELTDETRKLLVNGFVTLYADDNPHFSPSKFRDACEPERGDWPLVDRSGVPALSRKIAEPVTILKLALYRLGLPDDTSSLNGAQFAEVGLQIMGGCEVCGATLAAYNACPSKSGYWRCLNGCIGNDGWYDVALADREIAAMAEQEDSDPDLLFAESWDED